MPTSLGAVLFYVFALFPGIAFFFAREGHRAPVRQSVLRETGAIVLVSTLCDGLLALAVALVASLNDEFRRWLLNIIDGDMSWPRRYPLGAVLLVLGGVLLVTLLGRVLGSQWVDRAGLHRVWKSWIPRGTTAWGAVLDIEEVDWLQGPHLVRVEVQLRTGRRIRGTVSSFENDSSQGAESALTLGAPISISEPGSDVYNDVAAETTYLLLRLVDIETMTVSYEPTIPVEKKRQR